MYNYLFKLSFCGSEYRGFQVQKNGVTIAEKFQDAFESVFKTRSDIKGCSRTDSGVHANEFFISVKCEKYISCDGAVKGMNVNLPHDIAVLSCAVVPDDFHARYSCVKKRYKYKIYNSYIKDPFLHNRVMQFKYKIDEELLNKAATYFIGTHDFTAFSKMENKEKNSVRTVFSSRVYREGDMVYFEVEGDGFLYNMVRIMVGTLLEVNEKRIACEDIPKIIASRNRENAGRTAPAQGLYLDKVYYEEDIISEEIKSI